MAEIKNISALAVSKASNAPEGPGVWLIVQLTNDETLSVIYKPNAARELAQSIETAANSTESGAVG